MAHRGDSFRAPENTLEAARLGWESGASAWELDVQLTRDGVPIVLHDESLLRTTDVARKFAGDPRGRAGFHVADFDFDEIRSLDAGSWFVSEQRRPALGSRLRHPRASRAAPLSNTSASGRVVIPTLGEALVFTREHDWLVNVEIKSFPERPRDSVEPVLNVIAETETASRVLISSFDHRDVAAANRPGREYALAILAMTPLYQVRRYAREIVGADTVHFSADVVGSETVKYRQPAPGSIARIRAWLRALSMRHPDAGLHRQRSWARKPGRAPCGDRRRGTFHGRSGRDDRVSEASLSDGASREDLPPFRQRQDVLS